MRRRRVDARRLVLVLAVLTVCFIWGNSLMPAEVSRSFSEAVKALLQRVLNLPQGGGEDGSYFIRKLAHWTEFLALGLELAYLLRRAARALPAGLSVALLDETIQLFIPGRAGQIKDVWIDFFGFCTGAAILLLAGRLCRRGKSD